MTIPGFTAEASFYKSTTSYRMVAGDTAGSLRVVPAVASCTSCYGYRTGPFTFRGNKLCCDTVCVPFAGCRQYCWVESCNPFPDGSILV